MKFDTHESDEDERLDKFGQIWKILTIVTTDDEYDILDKFWRVSQI